MQELATVNRGRKGELSAHPDIVHNKLQTFQLEFEFFQRNKRVFNISISYIYGSRKLQLKLRQKKIRRIY